MSEPAFFRMFNPRGIAVVGANTDITRPGRETVAALERHGYRGRIYPVNPKYDRIGNQKCLPSAMRAISDYSQARTLEAMRREVGQEAAPGEWFTVDQALVDQFVAISGDEDSTRTARVRKNHQDARAQALILTGLLCASLLSIVSPPVIAQGFPAKPVRILVGFPAGTSVDILGRVIAQKLNEAWQQPVIVDNRPGAAGNLAADAVAKSPGDGYTLLLANNGLAVSAALYRKLPFNPLDDLTPVVFVASAPLVLVVAPALPVKSLHELIALARSRPGQLNFASSGTGNSDHMAGELFKSMARIDIVHVPYKGSPQALTGIIGGETAMYLTGLPPTLPLIKAGRLRALGVSGTSRSAVLPGVPTIAEAGVPGYQANLWYGTFAPGKTVREVIEKLNGEIDRVLKLTDVRERFAALGVEPTGGTVADFAAFFRSDIATWSRVAKAAGLTLE